MFPECGICGKEKFPSTSGPYKCLEHGVQDYYLNEPLVQQSSLYKTIRKVIGYINMGMTEMAVDDLKELLEKAETKGKFLAMSEQLKELNK